MAVQARAEVTRKRIIDAAVGLSDSTRRGETGLADIIYRAEVTKGRTRRMGQQYSEHGMTNPNRERHHTDAQIPGRQGV